jgi:hypothetical protein
MAYYSLANHILRAILIWVLVFFIVHTIPILTIRQKLLFSTIITTIYIIMEYILLPTYVPDFCNVVCPAATGTIDSTDISQKLKLDEQTGPPVKPLDNSTTPAVPMEPVTVPISSMSQPPVVPSAVPTASPIIPELPMGQSPPAPISTSVRRGNY